MWYAVLDMAQYVYSGDIPALGSVELAAGTNNIGDVDVLTLPALAAGTNNIGDVDVLTLPALAAGTNNIGDVDVVSSAQPAAPSAPFTGKTTVTTAGTQVALGTSQALVLGVWIRAATANTGIIYVGDLNVDSTTGYDLAPGESQFFPIANRATLFVDASANSQSVSYYAV